MARNLWTLALLAVGALSPTNAIATQLAPGESTTMLSNSPPNSATKGTIIAQSTYTYNGGANLDQVSLVLRQAVVKEQGGTLDFCYQLSSLPTSNGQIGGFTVRGFAMPVTTDVYQINTLPGLIATNLQPNPFVAGTAGITYAGRGKVEGNTLFFNLKTLNAQSKLVGMGANTSSFIVVIRTNATAYTSSTAAIGIAGVAPINGISIFSPVIPAKEQPEPTSLVLFGGAFTGLGACGWWRRRTLV